MIAEHLCHAPVFVSLHALSRGALTLPTEVRFNDEGIPQADFNVASDLRYDAVSVYDADGRCLGLLASPPRTLLAGDELVMTFPAPPTEN